MGLLGRLLGRLSLWTAAAFLAGCAQLPSLEGRSVSTADTDTAGTRLGQALAFQLRAHPGLAGVLPLAGGHDAFAARATLAHAAERTLDIQYYIWRDDLSGSLLFDAVQRAADRGVRVRLLLDDNNTVGLDERLRALDAHPQIEVRLFNPFAHRGARLLDFLGDFSRVNRRMHNKSFTADNQVTVIGGRNVGDEYFAAGEGTLFVDLDVLAVGAVVQAVSRDFDRYWASESAYPIDRLAPTGASAPVRRAIAAESVDQYREAIARSTFVRDLLANRLPLEWAPAQLISDDPLKALGRAQGSGHLWMQLQQAVPRPSRELLLVSPYFVPMAEGSDFLAGLAAQGVQVRVVTNALEATDVPAVHSGYARWREPLLAAGVGLYELKREAAAGPRDRGFAGSSASSLHAKVFVIDRQRLFVGSFNFDPRSARLNTELGFVIESPALAGTLAERASAHLPERTYRLQLQDGRLQWTEQQGGTQRVYDRDPNTSWLLRFGVSLMSLLPIDDLL